MVYNIYFLCRPTTGGGPRLPAKRNGQHYDKTK